MIELYALGAAELLEGFRARRFSPVEVVEALATRIEELDPMLGAFSVLCLDRARAEALAARAGLTCEVSGAGRSQACRSASRTSSTRRAFERPTARRCSPSTFPLVDAEAVRRARDGRGDSDRQDADPRVRVGYHVRQLADGNEPEPLGARPYLGRVERRLRGRPRRATSCRSRSAATPAARSAFPPRFLRHRRSEADLGTDQHRRRLPARALARPSGTDGPHARRCGASPQGGRGR